MDALTLLDRRLKYKAHRVKVYEDTLKTPEGDEVYYDYVENRNGSGVLLIDEEEKLIFVKQFRNSVGRLDIEIPAGCVEEKDFEHSSENDISRLISSPEDHYGREEFESDDNPFMKCAMREAEEETGFVPDKIHFINYIIAAAGLFSERTAIYIGTDLKKGKVTLDPDEYIGIVKLSLEEALDYISEGKITDSKTIIAIYAYLRLKSHTE